MFWLFNAKDMLAACYGWSNFYGMITYFFNQVVQFLGLSFPPVSDACKALYDVVAGG